MKPHVSIEGRRRLGRVPLLALGVVSLVTGVWGGLVRLPLGLPIPTDAHLAVLHAGLFLRVGAELADWPHGRQWGGAIDARALALFVANTVGAFVWPANVAPPTRAGRPTTGSS